MKRSLASAALATDAFERGALLAGGEALGGLAAGLDDAGELALFLRIEQGHLADVVQVQSDGVIHGSVSQLFGSSSDSAASVCRSAQGR